MDYIITLNTVVVTVVGVIQLVIALDERRQSRNEGTMDSARREKVSSDL